MCYSLNVGTVLSLLLTFDVAGADPQPLVAERMMLHAHHLRIPFPAAGKCKVVFKEELLAALTVNGSVGQPMVEAQAADPFPIVDGDLRPVLPVYANG